jgi:hypothetical protein
MITHVSKHKVHPKADLTLRIKCDSRCPRTFAAGWKVGFAPENVDFGTVSGLRLEAAKWISVSSNAVMTA